jgi:hypothetical protein
MGAVPLRNPASENWSSLVIVQTLLQQVAWIVAGSSHLSCFCSLEAKLQHHKFFYECIAPVAHKIDRYQIVRNRGKQPEPKRAARQ